MSLIRLDDRERRSKKVLNRKQVFLRTDDSGAPLYVEARIGEKYRQMFEKNVAAYSSISSKYVGNLRAADEESLLLKIDYLGVQVPVTIESLRLVIELLWNVYSANARQKKLVPLRYLQEVQQYVPPIIADLIERFLKYIESADIMASCGYGVDDPVISNFTELNGVYYLVDLDNFQERISIWQQIGFVVADVDLLTGSELHSSIGSLSKAAAAHTSHEIEAMPLICGYASRLAIDIINHHKELDCYDPAESEKSVERLLSEIFI